MTIFMWIPGQKWPNNLYCVNLFPIVPSSYAAKSPHTTHRAPSVGIRHPYGHTLIQSPPPPPQPSNLMSSRAAHLGGMASRRFNRQATPRTRKPTNKTEPTLTESTCAADCYALTQPSKKNCRGRLDSDSSLSKRRSSCLAGGRLGGLAQRTGTWHGSGATFGLQERRIKGL